MFTYSEYHASKVELISQIGIKSMNSRGKHFSNDINFIYKDEEMNVNNYILYPLADALAVLEADKNEFYCDDSLEFSSKCVNTERNMLYYFGKLDAAHKYFNSELIDMFEKTHPSLYDELFSLHTLLDMNIDIRQRISIMKTTSEEFVEAFYKHFNNSF